MRRRWRRSSPSSRKPKRRSPSSINRKRLDAEELGEAPREGDAARDGDGQTQAARDLLAERLRPNNGWAKAAWAGLAAPGIALPHRRANVATAVERPNSDPVGRLDHRP